jgi:alpha-galactosidase
VLHRLLQSPSFDLTWEPRAGTFRLESPGRLLEATPGIEVVRRRRTCVLTAADLMACRDVETQLEDVHGPAHELQLHFQESQGLALFMRIRLYPGRPFVILRLSVTNVGPDSVRLRRFFLSSCDQGIVTTQPVSGFFVNGWQSWSHTGLQPTGAHGFFPSLPVRRLQGPMIHNARTPWVGLADRAWSEMVGALVTPREALIAGIVSLADQFGQVSADLRPGHLQMTVQTQLDGVPLAVGESRQSEWFYLEWVPLPNTDPFAQYSHAVAREMALAPTRRTPTGWGSWQGYGRQVGEADVMDNLASAALLADELPLGVIQLDEGYQAAWGDWSVRNERFPHSLQWLADRIRGSGFKPGLWLAPLVVERSSRMARDHPDWLLHDTTGGTVKAGLVSKFIGRALDATHPGVEAYLADLAETAVKGWGYEYLKLDFMYAGALYGRRYNPQMTRAQALRNAYRVIRGAVGPDIYLVGCGTPLGPAVGLLDAVRIGPDTAPHWAPRFWGMRRRFRDNPSLPSLRNSLRNTASRAWMHGRWWVNDPDVLILRDVGSELTDEEVLSQVTMVGLSGGLVLLSGDLDEISPERRALAATVLPPLLDGMEVLDLFEREMPEVVLVRVARGWARWRLVALFNWSDVPIERELPETVTLNERKAYHLVDFWQQRYLLLAPGALRPVLHLPPHGVVLLGIRSVKPDPHLVASSFHMSQGGEVTRWQLSENEIVLTLDIGRFARGSLWFALPGRPQAVTLDGEPLPDKAIRAVASGIWSVTCRINHTGTLRLRWPQPA